MTNTRPTSDPRLPVIDSLDYVWQQLIGRLEGITAEELAWEPVANTWTVQAGPDGVVVPHPHDAEVERGPVPTINWRLWHIAIECIDDYSERLFGRTFASVRGRQWHLEPEPVRADLVRAYQGFRESCLARTAEQWWDQLGDAFGPWHAHHLYDLVEHCQHEVAHHGAEVALLRDLYREQRDPAPTRRES